MFRLTDVLIKIDCEGYEYNIILNTPANTIEFHDFLWPELSGRVRDIIKKLVANGFYCIPFSFFTNGDILFVRKELLSPLVYLYLKFILSYAKGILRLWQRLISSSRVQG